MESMSLVENNNMQNFMGLTVEPSACSCTQCAACASCVAGCLLVVFMVEVVVAGPLALALSSILNINQSRSNS